MKIQYKEYDFVNWTVREREADIDFDKAMENNAFFQRLKADSIKAKARRKLE